MIPDFTIPRMVLIRGPYSDQQVKSRFLILEGARLTFDCAMLELPWKDNARKVSCIPAGIYPVAFTMSPRFGVWLWEILQVPGRSGVRIHAANYVRQLEGCLAPGDMHIDLNKDGIPDVRNSRITLEKLHMAMCTVTRSSIHIIGYEDDLVMDKQMSLYLPQDQVRYREVA